MSYPWLKNLAGGSLDEGSMSNISRPRTELNLHVTLKAVQAGALLGGCLVGPATALVKGQRDLQGVKHYAEVCGKYGMLLGLVAGPLMTQGVIRSATQDAVWDRCYRLRYNRNQNRVDRLCFVGAAAGYLTASYLGDSAVLGTIMGINTGIILGAVLNAALS